MAASILDDVRREGAQGPVQGSVGLAVTCFLSRPTAEFWDRYIGAARPRLVRIASAHLGYLHAQYAEDAVQEALTSVWQRLQTGGVPMANAAVFQAYLLTALRNKCTDVLRSQQRPEEPFGLPEDPPDPLPDPRNIADEPWDTINDALCLMRDPYRAVIVKLYLEGYRNADLAHEMQVSEDTVASWKRRGLVILRGLVQAGAIPGSSARDA